MTNHRRRWIQRLVATLGVAGADIPITDGMSMGLLLALTFSSAAPTTNGTPLGLLLALTYEP